MHSSTFEYLKPTDAQVREMAVARQATKRCADTLDQTLPEGDDKDYALRLLREVGMWANVSITRCADGTPRQ